jgi:hypothetical protein
MVFTFLLKVFAYHAKLIVLVAHLNLFAMNVNMDFTLKKTNAKSVQLLVANFVIIQLPVNIVALDITLKMDYVLNAPYKYLIVQVVQKKNVIIVMMGI